MKSTKLYILLSFLGLMLNPATDPPEKPASEALLIDNFETDTPGDLPSRWRFINSDGNYLPLDEVMSESEKFYVVEEGGNKFLRGYTSGEAQRISQTNQRHFNWSLDEYPRIRWEWRAHQLPEGASEKGKNDSGAAVYVTFGTDWLGRPKSIKYTYSSTLPVGTVVSFGRLKVIVASSGADGTGNWQTITRNVVEDYRRVFDGDAPNPVSITLWSDSDTTGGVAEVDFDDIKLLPPQ